ncbi:type I-B CRISPR-associated protein Cas5b [Alteribacillus iranensis]|uniref:CRISPR-associated protein Cas5t n=1 Tax=Alteribacillus iranensis TaxID=930128 RepID=A0A1I2BAQ5_9BACI|nr:type I-B CRISPR-associated protein Cas5b [Alteribacillus iranensis]SFE52383.1 CRISPR-associated protein Cas5t [Alteribacillus iranensis]
MKTLRLDLYQETACYKKPLAFKVGETYPLPPYSTVKGMLHALMDAKTFVPMRLSVQGKCDSLLIDYQSHYFFKKLDSGELPIIYDGLGVSVPDKQHITKMPLYSHQLYKVELMIHIQADEEIIDSIIHAIESGKAVSLGRWEDLVQIKDYRVVELEEMEEGTTKLPAYVPVSLLDDENYVPYRLNWKYDIVQNIRKWEKIDVGYVQANYSIEEEHYMDECGDLVFFHQ